jgi:hypothetical protein
MLDWAPAIGAAEARQRSLEPPNQSCGLAMAAPPARRACRDTATPTEHAAFVAWRPAGVLVGALLAGVARPSFRRVVAAAATAALFRSGVH